MEVPKHEKQGSRGCNPWSGPGQSLPQPPNPRKLGILGFQGVILKPFHASFKRSNQGKMLLVTLTLSLTLMLMLTLTITLTLSINPNTNPNLLPVHRSSSQVCSLHFTSGIVRHRKRKAFEQCMSAS